MMLGDCDKSVEHLCDDIGWRQDLDQIQVTSLEETLT